MGSVNQVILVGYIGSKDVVGLKNGRKIVQLSVATTVSYKNKNSPDEFQKTTEWHRCIVGYELAVNYTDEYLNVGDEISIVGSIRTNSWRDKNTGEKKSVKEISVEKIALMKKKYKPENYNEDETL